SDGLTMQWNAENMPVKVSGGAATVATSKSFLGESLWKKVQGSTTTYYLPGLRIENGAVRKFFGKFAERDPNDASCSASTSSGCLKFYQNDHLGSAVLVTNAAGTVVERGSYKPYGENRTTSVSTFTPTYQFTFKEKEKDGTGFYDFGARMYDPVIGRFLSADSITADGPNRYEYVHNNPLGYTDPTGHERCSDERYREILAEQEAKAEFAILDLAINRTLPGVSQHPPILLLDAGMRSGGPKSEASLKPPFAAMVAEPALTGKEQTVNSSSKYVFVLGNNNGLLQGLVQKPRSEQVAATLRVAGMAHANGLTLIGGVHSNGAATMLNVLNEFNRGTRRNVFRDLFFVGPGLHHGRLVELAKAAL